MKKSALNLLSEDPEIAAVLQQKQMAKIMESLAKPGDVSPFLLALKTVFQGEEGHTPIKGVDYFTKEEVAAFKEEISPEKFKDYFTDEEVEWIMGKVYEAVVSELRNGLKKELTPVKGIDYDDGLPGKDADPVDIRALTGAVLAHIPKSKEINFDEIVGKAVTKLAPNMLTVEDVVKEIKEKKLLELRDIKGARLDTPSNSGKFNMNDQRWHGAGSSSGSGTVTSVDSGTGLTGGPITTTGTISLNAASQASLALADTALQTVSVDGVTITGNGTPGNPLVAVAGGSGTVTSVSVVSANGVSGSVATATTTPAITLTLGAITPTSVNGITLSGSGSLANSGTSSLTGFTGSGTSSGTNTGDQTTITGNAGTATALQTARTIGIATGDVTSAGSSFDGTANNTNALTLATVNANVGSFGSATAAGTFTVNAKGLVTAAGSTTITPAVGSITGLGTGVATALGVNVGSAGAFVTFNGAGGTPSSLTLTNATGLPIAGISATGTPSGTTYLRGDGTWATPSTGGTPGGSDTYVQFNDSGSFNGEAEFAWSKATNILRVNDLYFTGSTLTTLPGTTPADIILVGGAANSGNNAGADVTLASGPGSGTQAGGAINMQSAAGGPTGAGGAILFAAGLGGATSGAGGAIQFAGGSAATSGAGGVIEFIGGSGAGTNQAGGDIVIMGGARTGSGQKGRIKVQDGASSFGAYLDTATIATSDKTFTFPNTSGTIALTSDIPSAITALTGDVTATGPGSVAATLATVNSNVGSFGSATQVGTFTVNAKGLTTAASNVTITPAVGSITGLGTGVATFLATPSSANLATAVTDETGSGALVFGTSPRITTSILDSNGATIIGFIPTGSAVNYLEFTNQATGSPPKLAAVGTDTDISINLSPKGAGAVAVNGVIVATSSNTLTLSNKTLTTPTINGTTLNGDVQIDGTPNTDDTWNGPSTNTFNAGATIAQFDLVYLSSSSTWLLTDADAVGTAGSVLVFMAGAAGTNGNPLRTIMPGTFVRNDAWNWTPGVPLFIDTATPGGMTATAPSGTDDVVRIVGHAVTADVIFFNPSNDWITRV